MVKNSQNKFQKKFYVYASRAEFFFPPSKHSIGTTVMDFERIFHVPFFSFNLTQARCGQKKILLNEASIV